MTLKFFVARSVAQKRDPLTGTKEIRVWLVPNTDFLLQMSYTVVGPNTTPRLDKQAAHIL